ncbi:MAG: protein jag [Clostridium sp.]|nr:protein jag [Clostridium sp.]
MDFITVTAKTVDEAVNKALIELGVPSDRLEYEVIERGSAGFLGFGAKQAVIRAKRKEGADDLAALEEEVKAPVLEAEREAVLPELSFEKEKAAVSEAAPAVEKEAPAAAEKPEVRTQTAEDLIDEKEEKPEAPRKRFTEEEAAEIEKTATDFLREVFGAMNIGEVGITSSFNFEENELSADLSGANMGVLIGKRGQTLDSLQYLVSLVVNRKENDYIRIKLDTENYRERRKETLETLARNIAYKVKRGKRPVSLEPMNPYERRIIHSALQNDKYVVTRSDGEEPYRHVTIFLKKREKSEKEARGGRKGGRYGKNSWNSDRGPKKEMSQARTEAKEAVKKSAPAPKAAKAEDEIPKWKKDFEKYRNSVNRTNQ